MKTLLFGVFILGIWIGNTGVIALVPSTAMILIGVLAAYVAVRVKYRN